MARTQVIAMMKSLHSSHQGEQQLFAIDGHLVNAFQALPLMRILLKCNKGVTASATL
jgi:hypothetical protein